MAASRPFTYLYNLIVPVVSRWYATSTQEYLDAYVLSPVEFQEGGSRVYISSLTRRYLFLHYAYYHKVATVDEREQLRQLMVPLEEWLLSHGVLFNVPPYQNQLCCALGVYNDCM